jgi:2,3-bisphosphoglycerate-dependent phosphoglycerate mutase
MTKLVLVRHGQGICNVERTIEGRAMCRGLSELGRTQGAALGKRLARESFKPDVVVSSPIRRAAETAAIIAAAIGTGEPNFDSDFEEVRPGEAEGMTWDQYSAFFGTTEGWDPNVPFAPGAEAWRDFAQRVATALNRITKAHQGKTVLVVAHGGVVDASMFHYFGLDPHVQSPIDFETSNTSITEWQLRTWNLATPEAPDRNPVHRWRLNRYNDAAHLETTNPHH